MPLDSWIPPPPPGVTVRYLREPAPRGLRAEPSQPDGPASEAVTAVDPVAAVADAAFATLGTQAALNQALVQARAGQTRAGQVRDLDRPADQVIDWNPQLIRSGRTLHTLMGVDDPLSLDAGASYDDSAYDAELRAALDALPEAGLAGGELAALDAFDMALGEGADMEEALSAAIAAAEAAGGPDWAAPPQDEYLARTPDLSARSPLSDLDSGLALAGAPAVTGPGSAPARPDAAAPEFRVGLDSLRPLSELPSPLAVLGEPLDPGFGIGFGFGPGTDPADVPLDFERRLQAARDTVRRDAATDAAASTVGTDIPGTAAADLLIGGGGKDIIGALAGDDYLYGDTPTNLDTAAHDAANPLTSPSFATTGGDDAMSGGAGADSLWGGPGDDQMHGDIPDSGSSLADEFGYSLGTAGFGDDALWGGDGADRIWGGEGNDVLYGEAGADRLYGGDGNDTLRGGDGTDSLEGNGGADALYGQAGADNLFGYAGDDVLAGGGGDDTLAGGDGADEFLFSGGSGADPLTRAQSLGTDTVSDYSAADGDAFGLSDADFGLGSSGNLVDGDTYFEYAATTLDGSPLDASGGDAGPAIVAFGSGAGNDGVDIYYTDNASAMTNANSYQIADIIGVNMTDIEAGDFFGRS